MVASGRHVRQGRAARSSCKEAPAAARAQGGAGWNAFVCTTSDHDGPLRAMGSHEGLRGIRRLQEDLRGRCQLAMPDRLGAGPTECRVRTIGFERRLSGRSARK
jgi:hypothetical protein